MRKIEKDPLRVHRPTPDTDVGALRALVILTPIMAGFWAVVIYVFVHACSK